MSTLLCLYHMSMSHVYVHCLAFMLTSHSNGSWLRHTQQASQLGYQVSCPCLRPRSHKYVAQQRPTVHTQISRQHTMPRSHTHVSFRPYAYVSCLRLDLILTIHDYVLRSHAYVSCLRLMPTSQAKVSFLVFKPIAPCPRSLFRYFTGLKLRCRYL